MTTVTRSKENEFDFPSFKTPLRTPMRTPIRHGMLSSVTLNDLAFYSQNIKHLKLAGTTSMNDLQRCHHAITTPIRLNKTKFSTPGSNQHRRALGIVNNNNPNSNHSCNLSSSDDLSICKESNAKHDESVILQAPNSNTMYTNSEDDLPHQTAKHCYEDTFDDLIPINERIERMMTHQTNGVNMFSYYGGSENTICCQSPQSSRIDISTLLDILN